MGFALDEIAGLRRVAVGTIRQQLKGIFARTGTNSQTDLVRLLLSLPQTPAAN